MILALLATLGAIVVAFVIYPVFTEAPSTGHIALDESALALSDLSDKKAMLFEAIRELDFERDSGKISGTDYETLRNDYLAQVSVVMEKLDALAPNVQTPATEPEPEPTATEQAAGLACVSCGADNPKGSNFCLECGTAYACACASCGESLPTNARFCNACGEKVSA